MKILTGLAAALVLVGCSTTQESEMDSKVAALTTCEKIDALIEGHKKGFPNLRMTQSSVKLMDIWKARYHLVGDSCQVWGWGSGKFSYVCTLTEPNEQVAREHYQLAVQKGKECLQQGWTLNEGGRDMGEGLKAEFTRPNDATVLTVVATSSPTLFKTEWKTYVFVGDPSDLK